MKRAGFARKAPVRTERRDRSAEFASVVIERPRAVMAQAIDRERPVTIQPRIEHRQDQRILDSARDEPCSVRIIGACNHDPATTVWSHWPGLAGDRGMGLKAISLCGAYCCSACHDVIDGRAPLPAGETRQSVMLDWFAGHMRSLVRLAQKGLL